jgi:uncharacterized damage-inducible protein DinB
MSIAASLLPEFDHEMAGTRRTLERVPESVFAFSPHEKSLSMQGLVTHLANLPHWTSVTIETDELDMQTPEGAAQRVDPVGSTAEAVEMFDRNVAAARDALAAASDETLLAPWTLRSGGQIAFTLPKVAVLRSFVMNHMIHHRGQLTVYLRMNDLPLPALYGPSADEES